MLGLQELLVPRVIEAYQDHPELRVRTAVLDPLDHQDSPVRQVTQDKLVPLVRRVHRVRKVPRVLPDNLVNLGLTDN